MLSKPQSKLGWIYVAVNVVQAAASLGLQLAWLHVYYQLPSASLYRIPIAFVAYSILIYSYHLVLVYDTIHKRNTFQAIGLIVSNIFVCVYTGISFNMLRDEILNILAYFHDTYSGDVWIIDSRLIITNIVLVTLFTAGNMLLVYRLYKEFQWTIYVQLQAPNTVKRAHFAYQLLVAFLKFDLIFTIGNAAQVLTQLQLVRTSWFPNSWSLIVIPLSIFTVISTEYCVRVELKKGMIVVMGLHLSMIAYSIYLGVNIFAPYNDPGNVLELGFCIVLGMMFGVWTVFVLIICWRNFNLGLKIYLTAPAAAFELAKRNPLSTIRTTEKDGKDGSLFTDLVPVLASEKRSAQGLTV